MVRNLVSTYYLCCPPTSHLSEKQGSRARAGRPHRPHRAKSEQAGAAPPCTSPALMSQGLLGERERPSLE